MEGRANLCGEVRAITVEVGEDVGAPGAASRCTTSSGIASFGSLILIVEIRTNPDCFRRSIWQHTRRTLGPTRGCGGPMNERSRYKANGNTTRSPVQSFRIGNSGTN